MSKYPTPLGRISARVHGARAVMLHRARTAGIAARFAESVGNIHLAASLRGKRAAYLEAADILERLDRGFALPKRRLP